MNCGHGHERVCTGRLGGGGGAASPKYTFRPSSFGRAPTMTSPRQCSGSVPAIFLTQAQGCRVALLVPTQASKQASRATHTHTHTQARRSHFYYFYYSFPAPLSCVSTFISCRYLVFGRLIWAGQHEGRVHMHR